jgi:hypothetical protein
MAWHPSFDRARMPSRLTAAFRLSGRPAETGTSGSEGHAFGRRSSPALQQPLPSPPPLHLPCRGRRCPRLRGPCSTHRARLRPRALYPSNTARVRTIPLPLPTAVLPTVASKTMDADAPATATPSRKPASHSLPPPPALFAARARSRVADLGAGAAFPAPPPDTPPRRSPITVPFLWEEAPGKPKALPAAATPAAANAGSFTEVAGRRQDRGHADLPRPLPLKLPPRLQQAASSFAAADTPLSPKTVLQGGRRRPRWARRGASAFRRTPSAGGGLFSRNWSKPTAAASNKNGDGDHERDAAGPDAPWCSPASSSSSSSASTCFGVDGHGHGGRARPADGREVCSEEDDGSPRGSVRITRFRRNRSLPSMTTSNLWVTSSSLLCFACAHHAPFLCFRLFFWKKRRLYHTKKICRTGSCSAKIKKISQSR